MSSHGLKSTEASARLQEFGPNALPEVAAISPFKRFLQQFSSPIIWLLILALVLDLAIWIWEGLSGFPVEPAAIAAILMLNALLGAHQEHRADEAVSKLKQLAAPRVWAYRDGNLVQILAYELVPGDVVRIEAGDRIPADGKLLDATNVLLDESVLTGESIPVEKSSDDSVFCGTQLVRGRSLLSITKTGSASTLGRLATSLEGIALEMTPLEKKVEQLGGLIARLVIGIAASLLIVGLIFEGVDSIARVLLFAVALAVAAVPEGMPAVLTLTLARGIQKMADHRAIVRRMSAVEALGSVTVIATDKTGTLTENQLFVRKIVSDQEGECLIAMVLANDADPDSNAGDPLEIALFAFAKERALNIHTLRANYCFIESLPFDSANLYMRVTAERDGRTFHFLKGAPEILLERSTMSDEEREKWKLEISAGAETGHRLLGFAMSEGDPDHDCRYLGIALLWDPPRPEVAEALVKAKAAGIRVVMVTGDHPATSAAVAESIGLESSGVVTGEELRTMRRIPDDVNIFARVLPEDKLRLVDMLKCQGHIVAMTGDGVNDAPALKRSDVGVAMGLRGNDVAREVSDLVLLDDNFATIVAAVEQGRGIYANIQKFIRFLFSTNLSEILIVVFGSLGAAILGLRDATGALLVPLVAVQLLWINIITDGPPALALGFDDNRDLMRSPPRDPSVPLLDRRSTAFILIAGTAKAGVGLLMLLVLPWTGVGPGAIQSTLFQYTAVAQLAYAYPARGVMKRHKGNAALVGAIALGIALQLLCVFVPAIRAALALQPLTPLLAGVAVGSVVVTWLSAEALIRIRWLRNL